MEICLLSMQILLPHANLATGCTDPATAKVEATIVRAREKGEEREAGSG
jgi:hypothetical protein